MIDGLRITIQQILSLWRKRTPLLWRLIHNKLQTNDNFFKYNIIPQEGDVNCVKLVLICFSHVTWLTLFKGTCINFEIIKYSIIFTSCKWLKDKKKGFQAILYDWTSELLLWVKSDNFYNWFYSWFAPL